MKLFVKIILGLVGVIVVMAVAAWVYFGSGEEIYPEGLSVGAVAPTFEGEDQYGNLVNLANLTAEGDVVLVFFRGTWCPTCNQHIAALQDSLKQLEEKGAFVVAITPEKPEFLGENDFKTSVDIPVVYDQRLSIMNTYNVTYTMSLGSQRIFDVAGVDFNELYGTSGKMPIPATYVIGSNGKIKYASAKDGGLEVTYSTVKELLAVL
ncbi:MAG: peroxiredoxin-like family protein [Cyclobacteriaceae bacterium]